jgi:ATP-binding cassette, subfamily B (MDR/TAP), member 1
MNVTKAASAATDFFAVIDAPKPEITGLKDPDVSPLDDIVLDSVTFAYPTRPHVKVLDNLSMRFESGKITAIVGASGSGKSTIVGLLERWYNLDKSGQYKLPESAIKDKKSEKVTEKEEENKKSAEALEELKPPVSVSGSIKVGTHNLDSVDLKWWRSQIGLVQQEPFIFNDSIYKNVENGLIGSQWENEDAATKKALVEEACKEAFADEFINRLPQVSALCNRRMQPMILANICKSNLLQGYDTQVGDAGIKLSGGQRQRLAIARSIIKRPKILILDEATSSIDVRGERLVQAALDKVSEGRTTITIAHRLSTIKKADKIVVLKKGNVIEEGTHESLLENEDGAYWALVNAQKLIMGETFADESDLIESSKTDDLIPTMSSISEEAKTTEETTSWKRKGFFNSFGRLLYEQSVQWPFYTLLLIGCIGAASAYPLQAWLFAKLLNVVVLPKDELPSQTSYWALRFFILGLGAAASYFILGSSSNAISVVS